MIFLHTTRELPRIRCVQGFLLEIQYVYICMCLFMCTYIYVQYIHCTDVKVLVDRNGKLLIINLVAR
jgi:hypothetical protein